ncbi:hypothetical protein [Paenirhodobacter enshiensis]|uniref:Uncharacterized protein n=1 Tax=Paenirhodobacter enshiensis TaxID=1105367 RepID=A0A086XYV1_9RHOB|nr:hypothetical protein [Paenirhodobacter enshiensis]KFI27201.1 hypothetical protein CG50_00150 [Paenirhodobacter enshiensis]
MADDPGIGPVVLRISEMLERSVALLKQVESTLVLPGNGMVCAPQSERIRAMQHLDRVEQVLRDCTVLLGTLGAAIPDLPAPDGLMRGVQLQEMRDFIRIPSSPVAPPADPADGEIHWL